jgi:putative ABC transport system substrate-binding protein
MLKGEGRKAWGQNVGMVMRRRDFIKVGAGSVFAWPLVVRAQQPALPVIGYLSARRASENPGFLVAFLQGLHEAGYVEGQNVLIEYRWAEGQYDRLQALAGELVRRQVAVLVADGTPSAPAVKAATSTIPIVFQGALDPVALGIVTSLNRPGGNATGITSLNLEIGPKRLELLHLLLPNATAFGLLLNPANPTISSQLSQLQAAARSLGVQLHVLYAGNAGALDAAFASLSALRADALAIGTDPFFNTQLDHLAALALRYATPAIYSLPEFAAKGGLMSYGGSVVDQFRVAGTYVGRILKGEKPAELPVQQVTEVKLTINLKTAKTLGLTVPLLLLARADDVIE